MANYFRTYGNLKEELTLLNNKVANTLKLSEKYIKFENLFKNSDFSLVMKQLFGIRYFDLEIQDAFQTFRSNRFFWDCYPGAEPLNHNKLDSFYQSVKSNFGITQVDIAEFLDLLVSDTHSNFTEINIDYDFLDKHGYLIIPNALDLSMCDEINELTVQIAEYERDVIGKGYVYGSGKMQRIYSLISKHKKFQELLVNPIVHAVMSHMFHRQTFHEKYYLTSFHANILEQGTENQIWHIDANVPEPIPPWIIRSNSNYITQDYTIDTGATEIIPGSHLWCNKPSKLQAEAGIKGVDTKYIEAPKGSLAFWHGHLWHRSGRNVTPKKRVALLGAYAASHFREVCLEENPYLNFDQNQISDMKDDLKKLLGWDHGSKYYYF